MAKNEMPAVTQDDVPVVEPITVSLNEFCTRLSETVIRPELIGAFAASERAAGNTQGSVREFETRYTDFINKPV